MNHRHRKRVRLPIASPVTLFLFAMAALATGCGRSADDGYQPRYAPRTTATEMVFAVHPLHNPERLFDIYGPLIDELNAHVPGTHFRLEASRNYAEFEKKLYARRFQFALPNPYQTINAVRHGYRIFGKMGDDENFRGIILVRKDAHISTPSELSGKAIAFPAPTALAATMLPQYFLYRQGLLPGRDYEARYVGSQESSMMNVYLGKTAAGATWPPPWQAFSRSHPDIARELDVKWQTDSLPNNGLVVRDDVPDAVVVQVAKVLFSLQDSTKGRIILSSMPLSRFEPATASTYRPVQDFVRRFDADLKVEQP